MVNRAEELITQLEAEILRRDARLSGAERCAECLTITARLDGDGCAKWCCCCGARLNGDYVHVAALKARQPSAGVVLPDPVECGGLEDFADKKGERQITIDDRLYCDHYDDGSIEVRILPDFVVYRADEVARLNPCRAQAVPDGYVLVPVEPTDGLLDAIHSGGFVGEDKELREFYQSMLAATSAPPASGLIDPGWLCFQCGEHFADAESAGLHFGTHQHQQPACLIDVAEYRAMEARMHSYNEEDAEIHRATARMHGEHRTALQREEEKGYARALKDTGYDSTGVIVPTEWRDMLEELQWQHRDADDHYHKPAGFYCPSCCASQEEGHASQCQIRALLAQSPAPRKGGDI